MDEGNGGRALTAHPSRRQFWVVSRNLLHDAANNGAEALRCVAAAMDGPRRTQYVQRTAPPRPPGRPLCG
jgi:hypothetical protein